MRIVGTQVCIGDDPTYPTASSNSCSSKINEGGFIDLDLPPGRYIFIYREVMFGSYYYNLAEVRVYQSPNLIGSASLA